MQNVCKRRKRLLKITLISNIIFNSSSFVLIHFLSALLPDFQVASRGGSGRGGGDRPRGRRTRVQASRFYFGTIYYFIGCELTKAHHCSLTGHHQHVYALPSRHSKDEHRKPRQTRQHDGTFFQKPSSWSTLGRKYSVAASTWASRSRRRCLVRWWWSRAILATETFTASTGTASCN